MQATDQTAPTGAEMQVDELVISGKSIYAVSSVFNPYKPPRDALLSAASDAEAAAARLRTEAHDLADRSRRKSSDAAALDGIAREYRAAAVKLNAELA